MNRPSNRFFVWLSLLVLIAGAGGFGILILGNRGNEVTSVQSEPLGKEQPDVGKGVPLNPVVRRIVEEGPKMPYLKLNFLIKELPLDLAPHDIDALVSFISGPCPRGFSDLGWGSLVNDIEECLTVQTVPCEKVARTLIDIFRDESKNQIQRDYALQHVGGYAIYLVHADHIGAEGEERAATWRAETESKIFRPLFDELMAAASQTSKPWCGTAINLLDGLLRAADYKAVTVSGLDSETIVRISLPVVRDESAPLNARLPALQAAARRDSPEAREVALKILSDKEANLMLIQSASAALARLGTAGDLPVLETASLNCSRHTASALREAIRSIESRLESN
ncbi:MAG: hypothetical protein Q7R22_004280 [Verrucomicrobiota bacterium JB025]|nr:hypothetical protein [Verrucomicrobiota bacterium JB025]